MNHDDCVMSFDKKMGRNPRPDGNNDRSLGRAVYDAKLTAIDGFLDRIAAEARADAQSLTDAYRRVAAEALLKLVG